MDALHQRLNLYTVHLWRLNDLHLNHECVAGRIEVMDDDALLPLHHSTERSVCKVHHLGDLRERPHGVQLRHVLYVFLFRLTLCDKRKPAFSLCGGTDCGNTLVATNLQWRNHLREDDNLAQWNEWELTEAARHNRAIVL